MTGSVVSIGALLIMMTSISSLNRTRFTPVFVAPFGTKISAKGFKVLLHAVDSRSAAGSKGVASGFGKSLVVVYLVLMCGCREILPSVDSRSAAGTKGLASGFILGLVVVHLVSMSGWREDSRVVD